MGFFPFFSQNKYPITWRSPRYGVLKEKEDKGRKSNKGDKGIRGGKGDRRNKGNKSYKRGKGFESLRTWQARRKPGFLLYKIDDRQKCGRKRGGGKRKGLKN